MEYASFARLLRAISEFIESETDFKIVNATDDILKAQFIDCIKEKYIKELQEGYAKYNNRSLVDLFEHVDNKYAKLDEHELLLVFGQRGWICTASIF